MHRFPLVAIATLVTLLLASSRAPAWSYKEHVLMTRLAAQRILRDDAAPEGLKAFVREACPEAEAFDLRDFVMNVHVGPRPEGYAGLSYWAMHPDFDRDTPVAAFNSTEGKMHYVDLELLNDDPAKRTYADDLSHLPELADIPRDPDDPRYAEAGYLPFRVEQCYDQLVKAWQAGDAEAAVRWAGYLAHYLQDNTQPHHASIDYKSASYFEGVENPPNVHGWMEYGFVDDQPSGYPELRQRLVDLLAEQNAALFADHEFDPTQPTVGPPWKASVADSIYSYRLLPAIGEAAVATHEAGGDLGVFADAPVDGNLIFSTVDFDRDQPATLLQAKAGQIIFGSARVEQAWRQAWAESQGQYERPADARTPGLATRPTTRPGDEQR